MLNVEGKQKYTKILLNKTFGWRSLPWSTIMNDISHQFRSSTSAADLRLQITWLDCRIFQSDYNISRYHDCSIISSTTSPDWRITITVFFRVWGLLLITPHGSGSHGKPSQRQQHVRCLEAFPEGRMGRLGWTCSWSKADRERTQAIVSFVIHTEI